jgi:hypothetical protein
MKSFNRVLLLVCLVSPLVTLAEEPGTFTQTEYLTVVKVLKANQFLAYSKLTGDWKKHVFKEEVEAVPVVGGSVCAFVLSGAKITELVAVDRKGNWRPLTLREATGTKCQPALDREVAVYKIGDQIHAFSAITGTWDTLESKGLPTLNGDTVSVQTLESISMFSSQTGTWATASLTDTAANP